MSDVRVSLGERSYTILTADSYARLPARLASLGLGPHGWVISHARLLRRYGGAVLSPLRQAGWQLSVITVPESEASKSLAMAERLIVRLARAPMMRVPTLFAFGGGVVGDLTGFVAAIYRRGVPFVQLPTTLLAQVDSAIGGKTGVDLPQGKNLLGAFHQPRLVYNNLTVLRGLPLRQRRSGLAEVIKYGAIADPALLTYLEAHLRPCLDLAPHAARVMVERSCAIKARVASVDERETGTVRVQLNFGHTLGHALEAATGYRRFTHGEAIAVGMGLAAHLSWAMGWLPEPAFRRFVRLIERAGLPSSVRGVDRAAVLRALRYDKKFTGGRPRWVLLRRLGAACASEEVSDALVRRVLPLYVRDG